MQGTLMLVLALLGLSACQEPPASAPSPAAFQSPPAVLALPPDTPVATTAAQALAPALQQVAEQTDLTQAVAFQDWYGSAVQNQAFAAAPEAPVAELANGSVAAESGPIVVSGVSISEGYQLLAAKQGVDDQRFMSIQRLSSSYPALRQARYVALQAAVAPGVKRYNVFWHQVEGSGTASSTSASLTCPSSYIKFPANEAQRVQLGFQQYHCYNLPILLDLDNYLGLDASQGIESAAIMWGCPAQYQDPGCLGDPTLGKVPCAPTAASLYAWADFSALLASRWQGGPAGRITHFIVWNEVDSSQWFDMSPAVNDTGVHIEGTPAASVYVARYAAMLQGTHDAVAKNLAGKPSMVYVSLDRMWTASPWCPGPKWGPRCPLGASNFLNLLWQQIGTKFDWSLAVHPYGVATGSDWALRQPYQAYTFADLPQVQAYQLAQLRALGVSQPLLTPQAVMAASEQGWPTDTAAHSVVAAQSICVAHAIANNNTLNIAFVTHNDFQDPYAPYPASHGLIPLTSGPYLNATSGSNIAATHQAYLSTNINTWGISSTHFCCTSYALGCAGPPAPSPPPGAPAQAPRPPPRVLQLPGSATPKPAPPAAAAQAPVVRSSTTPSSARPSPVAILQLPAAAPGVPSPPPASPVPPPGGLQSPPPPAATSTQPVVTFGLTVTPQGSLSSSTILAGISAAIQNHLAPVPVNVTATLAQARRRLLQSNASYAVNVQVVFPAASQYSATSTAATTFAQQLTSSSSTVLAAASSVATLSLASPPTVTQKQTQSTASPSPHPPATAAANSPPPSASIPPPPPVKTNVVTASPNAAFPITAPWWGLYSALALGALLLVA